MFTVTTAKRLFAITAVLLPFDVYFYGQDIGWGAYFTFGRYVRAIGDSQYLTPRRLYELRSGFDSTGQFALYLWFIAAALALLTVIYVLAEEYMELPVSDRQSDRIVGIAFIVAGGLFIASRALLYDYFLFSSSNSIHWFSAPVGAVYMLFVGTVFYYDLFQFERDTTPAATATDG